MLSQTRLTAPRDWLGVVERPAEPRDAIERFSTALLRRLGETQRQVRRVGRHTPQQIAAILGEAESGLPVAELCRRHGMTDSTFYRWRRRHGIAGNADQRPVDDARLQRLEAENLHLRQLVGQMTAAAGS